jgi:hypothetical protein
MLDRYVKFRVGRCECAGSSVSFAPAPTKQKTRANKLRFDRWTTTDTMPVIARRRNDTVRPCGPAFFGVCVYSALK